jgi:putative transposase
MNRIHELWLCYPFYGYRRITAVLQQEGYAINTKRIRRLMRMMGIQALYPKPRLSANGKPHPRYPYVLDGASIRGADHVWGTDITYIKIPRGFVYLVALIDWYSRYVVAYSTSISLDSSFCVELLEAALLHAKPRILNSAQGVQFTSSSWIETLEEAKVIISMNGKGRCTDNAITERLWRSIKQESVYLRPPDTVCDLKAQLAEYITYYNHQRPHQSLGYLTPAQLYQQKFRR